MIGVGTVGGGVLRGVWIGAVEGSNGVAHMMRDTLDSVKCIRRPLCYLNEGRRSDSQWIYAAGFAGSFYTFIFIQYMSRNLIF